MHTIRILSMILALGTASLQTSAHTPSYPFEVKVTGAGKQSIIFIPGLACSGTVWDETLPNYEPGYTCYTLTMAGFAGTPAQPDPSMDSWVEGIAAYIKDKQIEKPIIIGHSIGGGMALMIAARHPELVSRIIVVDALPCLGLFNYPNTYKVQENPHCDQMVAMMTKMPDEQFLQMQKRMLPSLIADTVHLASVIQWGVQSDRKTLATIFCLFGNTDLREMIKDISCPALILLEAPFANSKPAVEAQYSKLKTANLQYANKGLHFIMYDDKNWYLQQMDNFLKK